MGRGSMLRMDEFRDSTPIASDATAVRERLSEGGCVFYRGLLDPQVIRAVRADVCEVLATRGWLEAGSDPIDARPGPVAVQEGRDGWFDAYIPILSLESFNRFAHDPVLCGA